MGVCRALSRPPTLCPVSTITGIRLPIAWTDFGWHATPALGGIVLSTGDPAWSWHPAAPAFAIHVSNDGLVRDHKAIDGGDSITGDAVAADVPDFSIDHVVLLVPDIDSAIDTLGRIHLTPRLRMEVSGRPAAFFRVGPVLEVIQAPVREASLYGIALATTRSLESLSLTWKSRGLEVGTVKPAIQPGRRIMTVKGLDAGLAIMSADGATS